MAYCSRQNMLDRFGEQELIQLTDRVNSVSIDDGVLNQAIADAEAEINAYLSAYPLPLAVVPAVLVRNCCDLARYFLYDDAATEPVIERYQAVIKFLLNVSRGVISLGVDASGQSAESHNHAVMTSGGRIFSRDDSGFL